MTIYDAHSDGHLEEIQPTGDFLMSDHVIVLVSTQFKRTFVWIGGSAGIRLKFTAAREAQAIRMKTGYRVVNVEEGDDSGDFFAAIQEERSNGESGSSKTPAMAAAPRQKEKTSPKAKPKPTEVPIGKKTVTAEMPARHGLGSAVRKKQHADNYGSLFLQSKPSHSDLQAVLNELAELPDVSGQERDYVLAGGVLYFIPSTKNKVADLKDAKVDDGAFYGPHYNPRFLVKDGKLLAVEFWRARK